MSALSRFRDISHPFDQESQVEVQQLFTFFCNNLALGQWELARVCLRNLCQKQKALGKRFKEIVRAVIDQPHVCSHGSSSVQSPFHLSWLCLVEYLDTFTKEEDALPQLICSNTEFRLLLYTACKNAPTQVLQDLDNYHSKIVYRDPELFSTELSEISSSTLSYVKHLLNEDTQLGHEVIAQLTGEGRSYLNNNQTLQKLYIESIEQHLQTVDSHVAVNTDESLDTICKQAYSYVYRLLSLINPCSDMTDLSPVLDLLFKDLLKRTRLKGHKQLDISKIYSCLIGRKTTYLIKKFSDIENKLRLEICVCQGLEKQFYLMQSSVGELLPSVQVSCYQSLLADRQEAWKLLYFHGMDGEHVLEDIVETALLFVKDGDFHQVTKLLEPREFAVLKPLVLLLGWPHCYSCDNALSLLGALWQPKEKLSHPLLDQACQKLAYQVQLVQWCLQRAGPLLASSDDGGTSHQQASEMFQGLESQSVLRVLHKSTNLARLPEKEVFELLKKRPVFSTSVSLASSLSGLDNSDLSNNLMNSQENESCSTELHPEVQRDIVLYHSYLALKYFMNAVMSSLGQERSEAENMCFDEGAGGEREGAHDNEITKNVELGLGHLHQVYPLAYRIEIIENIFSLLFTTYEDLYDSSKVHRNIESDEQETGDDEAKSLSRSSHAGSLESLASLSSEVSTDAQTQFSPWKEQQRRSPDVLGKSVDSSKQTFLSDTSRRRLFQKIGLETLPAVENLKQEKPNFLKESPKKAKATTNERDSSVLIRKRGSSNNDPHVGFIANEKATQEILRALKESLIVLNAEKFKTVDGFSKQDIRCSFDWLRTDVSLDTLEQHISRLSQYVNEAQWRFQLVTWNEREREEMMNRGTKGGRRRSRKYHQKMASGSGSDWMVTGKDDIESDEDEAEERKSKQGKSVRQRGKGDSDDRSGESFSSPYLSQDITTGTENGSGMVEKNKKRTSRCYRLSSRNSESGLVIKDSTVIARMLSSPDTLIYMCMRRDNHDRAQQVVKMFNMKDEVSSQSTVFAEQYEVTVKRLISLQPKGRRILGQQGIMKGKSVLGAVALAAAAGVTSAVPPLVDELLTSPTLPVVLSSQQEEVMTPTKFALAQHLLPSLVPTMICVDLACTVATTGQTCKALLEMANDRLNEDVGILREASSIGVVPFLNRLRRLLVSEERLPALVSSNVASTAVDKLQLGTEPINATLLEQLRNRQRENDNVIVKMEEALEEGDSLLRSIELSSNTSLSKQQRFSLPFSKTELNKGVRMAMAELQKVFSASENVGYQLSFVGSNCRERYEYVRTLVKHVDTLATLILYWQHSSDAEPEEANEADKHRLVNTVASNPFVVMNEALAENLGRPMFEKNVAPKRLEAMSKQLNVDLVKVILYNCCPSIPSKRSLQPSYCRWPSCETVVLNTDEPWTGSSRDPNVVANELLTKMVDLLKGVAATHGGTVDSFTAAQVIKLQEFQNIIRGIPELQKVDLDLLHSNTAKYCFFMNVLNLLLAHASLVQCGRLVAEVDQEEGCQASITRHGLLNKMDSGSTWSLELNGDNTLPVTALGYIAFLKTHCYKIGQLGVVSAFDLRYVILHSGLLPPATFGSAISFCFPERSLDDPKRRYRPLTPDRRVVFGVCDGCLSSPKLQVFDVADCDCQLNNATMQYINSSMIMIEENGQVVLPELIKWYRKDYDTLVLDDASTNPNSNHDPDIMLLMQLKPFFYRTVADKFQKFLPDIKEVLFSSFNWKFGYRFDVSGLESSTSSSNLQRSSSAAESLYQSLDFESSIISRKSLGNRGKYRINKSILEYLQKSSPLMAALVSLICPVPLETTATTVKENSLAEMKESGNKAIESKPRKVEKTDKMQELPFKVTLQRVAKFKPLQRYLVAHLYPIAELITESVEKSNTSRSFSYSSFELVRSDSKPQNTADVPEISLFPLSLASEEQIEVQKAFLRGSDYYLRQGNFKCLLELISSSDLQGDGGGGARIDFLFTSAVLSRGGKPQFSQLHSDLYELGIPELGRSSQWQEKPWTLLPQIRDNDQLAELVLSSIHQWNAQVCLDVLILCLSRPPSNCALVVELERKRREIILYQKIVHCSKTSKTRAIEPASRDKSYSFLTQWQGVSSASQEKPELVVEFLLSLQQYELAKDLVELHSLSSDLRQTIQESHLKYLLESSAGSDSMKAYRILESMRDKEMTLKVCDSLLKQNLHVSQTLFLIQFMLLNLPEQLSPIRRGQLICTKIGAKALLCLPESIRPSYDNLVSRPLLLLEQLLMNMKVEWAASVFRHLQNDLNLLEDGMESPAQCLTVKAFDDLLTSYASKALEFQVIQTDMTKDDPVSVSEVLNLSASPSVMSAIGGRVTPASSLGRQTPLSMAWAREQSEQSSQAGSPDRRNRRTPGHSRNPSLSRKISGEVMQKGSEAQLTFIPPAVPPNKENWIRDEQVSSCMVCHEQFSMFNRRHHCRRCGRVVCGSCSPHNCVVDGYGNTPVRVCSACFERFYSGRATVLPQETIRPQQVSQERNIGSLGNLTSSDGGVAGDYLDDLWTSDHQSEGSVSPYQWKLTLDEETNAGVREDFFYEQAPSSSLCMSILDLHSDSGTCGRFILELANTLSQKLVPVTPGAMNEEVDHNLIIGVIRYLLFNAKLKLSKAGDTSGFELCDTYLSHVELMKFLVESNCGDIPSLQDLIHPESARRLRDRFIEDERLKLAIEVSTKCGLDPSTVWAAAGLACLQTGDFAAARDKFSRCLKPVESKQQQQNSQYLDKIIDIIQSSPLIPYQQSTEALLAPLAGLQEHSKSNTVTSFLDATRYEECLYYLRTYGTPASIVAFYVKHSEIKMACRYVLDKKCPTEVFVESLLMRLISKGQVTNLKEQMEIMDPSLQLWKEHLTAACRYLLRRGYHNVLYEMQLFMKDYFRAAQTCIRFFEGSAGGGVSTYEGLHSRLSFLTRAKFHVEAVISERKTPKGSIASAGASLLRRAHSVPEKSSTSDDMAQLTLTMSELKSYLNTINLQMEVTSFVHKSLSESGGVSSVREGKDGRLPTLFGSPQKRGEVAAQVLLSGASVQDGFSLACRIIQDFNLPAGRVYVDTGRSLARQYKYAQIQQLLRCVGETGQVDDKCYDDIILACVRIVSADQTQSKQCETLVKLLKSNTNKINAFMACGKLKSAYLTAVKQDNPEVIIKEIAEAASKTGQVKMVEICSQWLAKQQRTRGAQQKAMNPNRRNLDSKR